MDDAPGSLAMGRHMNRHFYSVFLALAFAITDCPYAHSSWLHILDDSSLLNRAAEAFGVRKEYATLDTRASSMPEDSLTAAQVEDKDRLIDDYLTFMRTGRFDLAQRVGYDLRRYSRYVSIRDFENVARKTYQGQPEVDDIQFVFFPSFYRKVYSAVVNKLGAGYQQLWWPIGVYPVRSSGQRYYFVVVSYSSPRALFLLDSRSNVVDRIDERHAHGGMCDPYSVFPYLKAVDGELFSKDTCGNCTSRSFFYVADGRITKLTILHDQERSPSPGPQEHEFCQGCGTIGSGCDCAFVPGMDGMEELVCTGYERQTYEGQETYLNWTDTFRWVKEKQAFIQYERSESRKSVE